jgi:hypothetical protein
VDIVIFIPDLLDGLFARLGEPAKEIRQMAYVCLSEMLEEIKENKARVDFVPMIKIILRHCQSADRFIHLTAIRWLSDFVLLAHNLLMPFVAHMITVVLPSMAHEEEG